MCRAGSKRATKATVRVRHTTVFTFKFFKYLFKTLQTTRPKNFTKTYENIQQNKIQCIHKRMMRFQKLTRNLFLTLHWYNVHRQLRQLSKFLMRYQRFASHAYCGAAEPVSKMASQQGKAFCVLRFEVSRSVITGQNGLEKTHRRMVRLF